MFVLWQDEQASVQVWESDTSHLTNLHIRFHKDENILPYDL
jgi:hypothetical protein